MFYEWKDRDDKTDLRKCNPCPDEELTITDCIRSETELVGTSADSVCLRLIFRRDIVSQ